ncbi:MAG: hypothetical protein Q9M91_00915 [Candidatus Dojkabacteria bacterium]|nr:hypothetical protein [Candidatus Dojkabacteria bacterium]
MYLLALSYFEDKDIAFPPLAEDVETHAYFRYVFLMSRVDEVGTYIGNQEVKSFKYIMGKLDELDFFAFTLMSNTLIIINYINTSIKEISN